MHLRPDTFRQWNRNSSRKGHGRQVRWAREGWSWGGATSGSFLDSSLQVQTTVQSSYPSLIAWRLRPHLSAELDKEAICLLDIHPRKSKTLVWKNTPTPAFVAASPAVAEVWKPPRRPSADERVKTMWRVHAHTRKRYWATRKNEILPSAAARTDLRGVTLSEISQRLCSTAGKTKVVRRHSRAEPGKQPNKVHGLRAQTGGRRRGGPGVGWVGCTSVALTVNNTLPHI